MDGYYSGYHLKYNDNGNLIAPSEPGDLCGKFTNDFVDCVNLLKCCPDGNLGYYN